MIFDTCTCEIAYFWERVGDRGHDQNGGGLGRGGTGGSGGTPPVAYSPKTARSRRPSGRFICAVLGVARFPRLISPVLFLPSYLHGDGQQRSRSRGGSASLGWRVGIALPAGGGLLFWGVEGVYRFFIGGIGLSLRLGNLGGSRILPSIYIHFGFFFFFQFVVCFRKHFLPPVGCDCSDRTIPVTAISVVDCLPKIRGSGSLSFASPPIWRRLPVWMALA